MDKALEKVLKDAHFWLLPPEHAKFRRYWSASRSPLLGEAEAMAVCNMGCDWKRTGSFVIPLGATLDHPAIRPVIRHIGRCRAAQAQKQKRRAEGKQPKPRYIPKTDLAERRKRFDYKPKQKPHKPRGSGITSAGHGPEL